MHCGPGIQAALNAAAIRSLVHQMVVTSLASYSLISCKEDSRFLFSFHSNSVSAPERANAVVTVVEFTIWNMYGIEHLVVCCCRKIV